MIPEIIVANTSPLIALAQIDVLHIVPRLFVRIIVPMAVKLEVKSISLPSWIEVYSLTGSLPSLGSGRLGRGEREVIALALELGIAAVLIDDRPARTSARAAGLRPIGTVGILVMAKQRGTIPTVRPHIDALRDAGVFLSSQVYSEALRLAGED